MTQITLTGVRVEFGATTLLRDVSLTIAEGERWGIVGRNGSGKTTLFRLITGEQRPSAGSVARPGSLRLSMLDQHRDFGDAVTVWEAAAQPFAPLIALEASLAEQAHRLADMGEHPDPAALDRYGHDMERFAHEGGYEFHAKVDAVLQGLGFDPEESKVKRLAVLSGGERGRVGLAAQLVAPADVLLLDEPTNHLDLETTAWLQQYLTERRGTSLVISHDRAFLDETVDHVLHIEGGTATTYRGGYSAFVTQRAERRLALERQVEQQRKFIAKEEEFIRRNIAGQNTKQAQGRRTRLARLPRLTPPPGESDAMAFSLEVKERGGDRVVYCDQLDVAVEGRTLVKGFHATAMRGDVVAIVGPNGAGKSTLLRTILGEREPTAGEAKLGGSITAAHFRQDLAQVPMGTTIYDCINDLRPLWTRGQIQGLLGAFGFSGDTVQRRTDVCSGGERSRLALAMITLSRANLLVLDEPTNHLDVESIEAIEDALDGYEGTVLLVSHDRAFLRELATRVWAFDGVRVEDFAGTFVEWEERQRTRAAAAAAESARAAAARREAEKRQAQRGAESQTRDQTARRERRRAEEEARAAEREVATREQAVEALRAELQDPALYDGSAGAARRAAELNRTLKDAEAALDGAMHRWIELTSALDAES
ncbi:MAG: ABC-F family ATP-binding cassette domain-containing protein [Gemmatimonadaceae bacterium]|nr:ABC-F family ATP-binding cassette domain-containing protein [Gemmatimonadaceae bacterium]